MMKKLLKVLAVGLMISLLPALVYADVGQDLINAQVSTNAILGDSFGSGSSSGNMIHESRKIALTHVVLRRSRFNMDLVERRVAKLIADDGSGIVATLDVENNTLDGYKLTLFSANQGKLVSLDNSDGQQDIQYDLDLTWTGNEIPFNDFQIVGNGGTIEQPIGSGGYTTVTLGDHTYGKIDIIVKDTAGIVRAPTDMSCDIVLSMSSEDEDRTKMAGAYSDTLVFVYEDL
jgi:hypothetical protein